MDGYRWFEEYDAFLTTEFTIRGEDFLGEEILKNFSGKVVKPLFDDFRDFAKFHLNIHVPVFAAVARKGKKKRRRSSK